jgi:pyruvate carboxylase subunit B
MANGTYTVIVDGQQYNVQIVDGNANVQSVSVATPVAAPVAVAPVAAPVAAVANANAICAELPGSVFKLVAAVGDSVNAGDKIMILEAMKMEIDVVAPRAGKVTSISVNVNDKIEAGQVLAVVE